MKRVVTDLPRQLVAEFVGTFFLALLLGVVAVGVNLYSEYQSLFVPLLIGSIVGVMVYLVGEVSGAHFNPAVSLGIYLQRGLTILQLIGYIIVQILGAYAGFAVARELMGSAPDAPAFTGSAAFLGEFLGAFLLVLAVSRVLSGAVDRAAGGAVIGAALAVGVSISLVASGGVLNPALSLAVGAHHLPYLVAPFLGGAVAAGLSAWLSPRKLPA